MEITELHYLLYLSIGLLNVPWTTGYSTTGTDQTIRLVNGPHQCAGRVEIFYRGTWGTVCDDLWTMNNGHVVCREMGCGSALEITKQAAQFGEGKGGIWLDDVQCSGTESALADCRKKSYGDNDCSHSEDAGVVCLENIRLVNGTDRCSGRVEVKHNNQWRGVCNSGWRTEEAELVCGQLECGTPVTQPLPDFGVGSGSMYTSSCLGNESALAECRLEEFNHTCADASVICKHRNMVRLVNGTNRCSGRVEVYHEGRWGSVCDDRWGMEEVEVVCRELDCGTPLAVKFRAYFGHGLGQVWMDDVECIGHESSLTTCRHRGFGSTDCNHSEDAGVVCSDAVRLMNGTNRCSGRVEVNHAGHWVTISNTDWTTREANLVCEEMDCGKSSSPPVRSQPGEATVLGGYTTDCIGTETSITQCSFQAQTTRLADVSLTCSGDPRVRLVNGTSRCSGRVEVRYDSQWGTVCDDQWDIRDAAVLCRVLDCGSAQKAVSGAYFGSGTGPVWWSRVSCVGNETSLAHCRHQEHGENSCPHRQDAGLICSSDLRLINGSNQCSGRVQVYQSGRWSPVYQQNWEKSEATVVCKAMECGDPVMTSADFGQGSGGPGFMARCSGTENSITDCQLRPLVKTVRDSVGEATVTCSGTLKLVNGSSRCSGRVEVFNGGHWGTVCSDSWDMNAAHVVCRQLNCGVAHAVKNMAYFGQGSGRVGIERLHCNGGEASINLCMQGRPGDTRCDHTSAAGVICTESLEARLVGGREKCSGRVEVRHGDEWGTVCDRGWTRAQANVVCKLLECGSASEVRGSGHYGQGTGSSREASDACFSSEASLLECSQRGYNQSGCGHERDAGVDCAEKLRLVNGKRNCSGRVEIFHSGQWGTVCDDDWVLRNADVVCRQMNCGEALSAPTNGHFGSGIGMIWLDNVNCQGQENAITQCSHNRFGSNDCSHGEDAGVVCFGSLEKPQISLSTASQVNPGDKVEFTCSLTEDFGGTFILEKAGGHFKLEKSSMNGAATFNIPEVNFGHTGSYSCQYRKVTSSRTMNFPQGDPVELSVRLEQPSITLTSHQAMMVLSPNTFKIDRGNSFSIKCSIHCTYNGSYFYLTRSNISITDNKLVSQQTTGICVADFTYVAASEVQGEYNCIYGVSISTSTSTSTTMKSPPSKTVTVTVPASSAVSGVLGGLFVLLLILAVGLLVWRRRQLSGDFAAAMVLFNNIVGRGAAKDTSNGVLDDRYYFAPDHGDGSGGGPEEKHTEENAVEKTSEEDLTGRASHDLQPLINL